MQILHAFVKQRFSVGIVSQIAVPLLQLVRNLDRAVSVNLRIANMFWKQKN